MADAAVEQPVAENTEVPMETTVETPVKKGGKARAVKTTPKSKATPKTKKTSSDLHPKYSQMIGEAISMLKDRHGSSRQAILKYIKANFNVLQDEKVVNNHIKMSLRAGVKSGKLKQCKGSGACGSYKLGEKSTEKSAKPKPKSASANMTKVKKPKAVTTKKTKTPAKKATGTKTEKVVPEKAKSPAKKASKSPKKAAAQKATKSPKKAAAKKPKAKKTAAKKATKSSKKEVKTASDTEAPATEESPASE